MAAARALYRDRQLGVGALAGPLGVAATLTGVAVLHLALMPAAVGVRDVRTMTGEPPTAASATTS